MDKRKKYETVIVGGGPSGCACGIKLLEQNRSCCIIDKAIFPRDKVCGGLLPEKTITFIHSLMPERKKEKIQKELTIDTSKSIAFYKNNNFIVKYPTQTVFTISDRKILDNYLVEYYKKHNGIIYEGVKITKIDFNKKIIYTNKEEFEYQYLVAADGVNSYVRKELNLKPIKKISFIEYDIEKKDFDGTDDLTFFDYKGEQLGWSFPKGKYYNIGLGFPKKEKNAIEIMNNFLKELGVRNIEKYKRKGALLPNTDIVKPYAKDHILFVGDAGSFTEPMTGEGIFQALFSGVQAAISIINGKNVVKTYNKKTKTLRQSKRILKHLQWFIYHCDDLALNRLKRKPYSITKMVDGHIGKRTLNYNNLISFIISYKKYNRNDKIDKK